MKIDEIIASLGGGAILGWIGKWRVSREPPQVGDAMICELSRLWR